jgi:nitrate/nitrite transporter NarK
MPQNRGRSVALAGTGINLALGILYAWSIFKSAIADSIKAGGPFDWDPASINDPYALSMLVFAFSTIIAGRMQDKLSPRLTALIGGLLVGAGFISLSFTTSYLGWMIGFGVLAGAGFGFGYAASCPPAIKWFPPSKTGVIAGVVVSGFGLAPVYIAPLSTYLLNTVGLQKAMLFYGAAFTLVVCGLSMMLVNPPPGYVPEGSAPAAAGAKKSEGVGPAEMLKTSRFYLLWICYFIGAGAGLMVIGFASGLAKQSMGNLSFIAVAIMAIGNASGRIVAGIVSDKIGRRQTLFLCLTFQAVLMFAGLLLVQSAHPSAVLVVLLATFIGFNYGTNLSLFPAIAKDLYGLKSFGLNYGFLFTAWGVGGFVLARVSQMLSTKAGNYNSCFVTAGVLLILGAALTFALKKGEAVKVVEARPELKAA